MFKLGKILACLTLLLLAAGQVQAAEEVKNFAVVPFTVNGPDRYSHLSQGIQDMFNSRLSWANRYQPLDKSVIEQKIKATPKSQAEAKSAMSALNCEYLVYGSLTISGDQASLDTQIMDKSGQVWTKSAQTKVSALIQTLEGVAKDANAEVFKHTTAAKTGKSGADKTETINQLNPNFNVNQTNENQQVYLNPNMRYAGSADSPGVWRSQTLPFGSTGVAVGDVDGDGKSEIVIAGNHSVYVYRMQNQQLVQAGQWEGPARVQFYRVYTMRVGGDKGEAIVVSGSMDNEARSFVLAFNGGKLTPIVSNSPLYLSVAQVPPSFNRTLVGSRYDKRNLFDKGVYEASIVGDKIQLNNRLPLPEKANPFNFAYLPEESSYKVLMVNKDEKVEIYTPKGERQAQTEERYCGSGVGLKYDSLLPAMGGNPTDDYLWSHYYVPLPMLVVKFAKDRRYEVLMSRNISVASQFFDNFRNFAQGEVHSMYWDGVGINLLWKTRRLKGTITGYTVADIDGDGKPELVLSMNTYAGPSGLEAQRTVIYAYSLDIESTKGTGQFQNRDESGN